jgi:hypothetical protein
MRLLLVFLASLLVGQSISVGIGLLVEPPCDTVYRARDLHRLLFRDVLDGLALCRPCHRT